MQILEKLSQMGIPVPIRLLNKKDLDKDYIEDDGTVCGMDHDVSQGLITTICFIVSLTTKVKLKSVKLEFHDGSNVEWPMLNQESTRMSNSDPFPG